MPAIRLPYIHEYKDRHGKLRRYVRLCGRKRVALTDSKGNLLIPGSDAFFAKYRAAINCLPGAGAEHNAPVKRNSLQAAVEGYLVSSIAAKNPNTLRPYRSAIKALLAEHGHRPVENPPEKAFKLIDALALVSPSNVNLVIAVIAPAIRFAIKSGLRRDPINPFREIDRYEIGE